jgi:hypothetical protein
MAVREGQAADSDWRGQDAQNMTARSGQLGKDNPNRRTMEGCPRQDSLVRTAETGKVFSPSCGSKRNKRYDSTGLLSDK